MRLVIGGLCVLLGPLAGAGYGVYYFTHADPRTATATATVVRIERHRGGNQSHSECPVFTFLANDRHVEAESNACTRDTTYTPGDRVEVRYDPNDPADVKPAAGYDPHPEAIPLAAVTSLFTLLAAFFLWPSKRTLSHSRERSG